MKSTKWREFEKRIKTECDLLRVTCIKIPEKVTGMYRGRAIQQKSEFDFSFGIDGFAAYADAKASKEPVFNFKSKMLAEKKIHQWQCLKSAEDNFNIAGLLIWFYGEGKIVWASVSTIDSLLSKGDKGIRLSSEGISIQSDSEPINIRQLMKSELSQSVRRIGGKT